MCNNRYKVSIKITKYKVSKRSDYKRKTKKKSNKDKSFSNNIATIRMLLLKLNIL